MKFLLPVLFTLFFFTTGFSQDVNHYKYELSKSSGYMSLKRRVRIYQILNLNNEHFVITVLNSSPLKEFTINHYNENWEFLKSVDVDFDNSTINKKEHFAALSVVGDNLFLFTSIPSKKDSLRFYARSIDVNTLQIGAKVNYNSIDISSKTNSKRYYLIVRPTQKYFSYEEVVLSNQGQYFISECNYVTKGLKFINEVSVFDEKLNLEYHFDKTQFKSNLIAKQVQYVGKGELVGFYITPTLLHQKEFRWENNMENKFQYKEIKLFRIKNGKQEEISLGSKDAWINEIKYVRLDNGDIRVIGVSKSENNEVKLLNILVDGNSFEIVSRETHLLDNDKMPYQNEEGSSEQDSLRHVYTSNKSDYLIGDITINEDGSFYFITEQHKLNQMYVNKAEFGSSPNMQPVGPTSQTFGCLIVVRVDAKGLYKSVQYIGRYARLMYFERVGYSNKGNLSMIQKDNTIQIFAQGSTTDPSLVLYNCYDDNEIEKVELNRNSENFNNCILGFNSTFIDNSFVLMNMHLEDKHIYSFFTFNWF